MMSDKLHEIFATIESRKGSDPKESYTAKLHHNGKGYICQKVGEEATEVIVAALTEGKKELVSETADILYHLMALLSHSDIDISEVIDELYKRHGISGIDENQSRTKQ